MIDDTKSKIGKFRWIILSFMVILFGVNQVDKSLLGWASEPIMKEFNLNNAEWGIVSGSFFWLFSLSALIGGFLIDRIRPSRIISTLSGAWGGLQLSFLIGGGFSFLLFNRMLLGLFEGPAWITMMKMVKNWLPKQELGRGLGIVILGGGILPAVLSSFLIKMIDHFSWRTPFIMMGVLGIILTIIWMKFGASSPEESHYVKMSESNWIKNNQEVYVDEVTPTVPWRSILLSPAFFAVVLACIVHYYESVLFWTWSTKFVTDTFHATSTELSLVIVLGNIGGAFGAVISGYLADIILIKTKNSWYARGLTTFSGTLLSGICIMFVTRSTTVLLTSLCFGLMLFFNYFALNGATTILNESIPKQQTGRILGINFMIYSSMGFIAPIISGYVVESTNSYRMAFDIAAYLAFFSSIVIFIYLKPSKFNFMMKNNSVSKTSENIKAITKS
ncbi:MFS transporter [Gottfriedia sp. NPDC056225]|uniref:MFS transporter n=1 Tax=Gottfriedia sp. NPDC056225 TaxID=3345751 RepID=UPI0035DC629C